jgi:hypothetical protein
METQKKVKRKFDDSELGSSAEVMVSNDSAEKQTAEVTVSDDYEEKLTAELMESEGMKENTKMRGLFQSSYFFPICYDDAIVGVNALTQSIIYDYMRIGYLRILFVEWNFPDYGDTMYGCGQMAEWVEKLTLEELEGKVPPTLCLNERHKESWGDTQLEVGSFINQEEGAPKGILLVVVENSFVKY